MINYALIMAAGRGARLMPLTAMASKAMIEINGTPLISHSLNQLKGTIPYVVITVGYKGGELARHVIEEGASAVFNTSGKGNAWWLFNTFMKYIDEPVLVLTCDSIVKLDISFILSDYIQLNRPPCMVVPVAPVTGVEGDYISGEHGVVTTLSREYVTDAYCSGIQILNPFIINQLMSACEDFYEVWEHLIGQHQLYYSGIYRNYWYTINTVKQLTFATNEQRNIPSPDKI